MTMMLCFRELAAEEFFGAPRMTCQFLRKPAVKHGEVGHCERSENRGGLGGGRLQTDAFDAFPHLSRV